MHTSSGVNPFPSKVHNNSKAFCALHKEILENPMTCLKIQIIFKNLMPTNFIIIKLLENMKFSRIYDDFKKSLTSYSEQFL